MTEIILSPVTAGDHARGPADAPLTLVEYGDFQCPYCVEAHAAVGEIERRYAGRLRFVFRQFPLRAIHQYAEAAAEAAEAAGAQGRFWEMYDQLFAHSSALEAKNLRAYAQAAGVPDIDRFVREVRDGTYTAILDRSLEEGERSGVEGTPSFFINGLPFEEDPTVQALSAALEDAAA
jgi:protein-disulfide isomerase